MTTRDKLQSIIDTVDLESLTAKITGVIEDEFRDAVSVIDGDDVADAVSMVGTRTLETLLRDAIAVRPILAKLCNLP